MNELLSDAPGAVASGRSVAGDPQGRAALLLVESLLHGLVARSLISVAEAVDIVATAVDVEEELAAEATLIDMPETTAAALLDRIATSVGLDLPGQAPAEAG